MSITKYNINRHENQYTKTNPENHTGKNNKILKNIHGITF